MPELWYRALTRVVTMIYYRRVSVVRLAPLALHGRAVLFVGLHRNGAVDGMLYKRAFPRAVFLVARQLVRGPFRRLFFTGIPVVREQDDADAELRRHNPRALAGAVEHLVAGGQLFVLPEGTSDLGPRHLPFKPGAAKIVLDATERGVSPLVVPVGIFYESAPTFRSNACIVLGAPIDVALPQTFDRSLKISALMQRITAGLEAIAVEANDAASLHRIETLAGLADDGMGATRWHVQKILTNRRLPLPLHIRWTRLSREIADGETAVDRAGVPRYSRHGLAWNAAWLGLQAILVTLALLANMLPVIGAWYAGRTLSDAPNTIALWRILVGVPLTALWWLALVVTATIARSPAMIAAYGGFTVAGLVAYPELCARVPMLHNAWHKRSRTDADVLGRWMRTAAGEANRG